MTSAYNGKINCLLLLCLIVIFISIRNSNYNSKGLRIKYKTLWNKKNCGNINHIGEIVLTNSIKLFQVFWHVLAKIQRLNNKEDVDTKI